MATIQRPLSTDQRDWLFQLAEGLVYAFHKHSGKTPSAPLPLITLQIFEDFLSDWVCDRPGCGHSCTDHSDKSEEDAEWRDRRCRNCACAEFMEAEWAIEGE